MENIRNDWVEWDPKWCDKEATNGKREKGKGKLGNKGTIGVLENLKPRIKHCSNPYMHGYRTKCSICYIYQNLCMHPMFENKSPEELRLEDLSLRPPP